MNENVVKDKIKFTIECSQDEMVFLYTKFVATPIADKKKVFSKQICILKKRNTHQYLSPNSCHPKNRTKIIPIGGADRIRRNCPDNIINDITYKKRLIEWKAYLIKSGHNEKAIDKTFCKRAVIPIRKTLEKNSNKNQNNKMKFITEYEPSLPNIYSTWRKTNHLLKNNEKLKNIFKSGIKDFPIV